ncbi:MAG: hypothetical protein IT483_09325, partial [Gammaproteobacteria bacterium]|nr:hypothetical protein [Gammaproteobacteria bacterium]
MTKAVRVTLSASASALALSLAVAPMPAQASYPGEPQCVFDPVALTATCNDFFWTDTLTGNELAVDDLTLVIGDAAPSEIDTAYEPGILANWGGDITLDIGNFASVDVDYAPAVEAVVSGDFDATVINDGWVVSRGYEGATGILVRGQDDVSVQNHGLVAGVTYDGGEYAWNSSAVGIDVGVDGGETGGSVSILNDGVVYALGFDDSYYGGYNTSDVTGVRVNTYDAGVAIDNGGVSGVGQIFAVGDDATGIEVDVRGSGAIAITNSGTVDVSAKYDAIGIEAYADESGITIDNLATGRVLVESDDYAEGILAVGKYGTSDVDNAGLVDVSGYDASGIVAVSFEGNAIVTNSGDVLVNGSTGAVGIGGVSVIGNVSITNTSAGDIEVAGGGGDRPVQGITGYTITGYYDGGDVTIVNAGDVLVSADYAAQGVVANAHAKYYGGDSGDITVTNSGRITVSAYGPTEGIFASTGNGAINITNTSTGVIDVTSEYERAVGIEAENDGGEGAGTLAAVAPDMSIRNDGRITVSGQNYVAGIYVDAAIGNVDVVNTRTITATGVEAYVAGIYAAAHAGDISISNTATGTITATSDAVYWDGGEYGYWIGGGADGVLAYAAGDITIDNAGMIDVNGEMSGIGIEARSNGGQITITNQALGHILVDSGMENAVGIEADNSGYYYGPQVTASALENGVPPGGVTIINNGIIA